MNSTRLHIRPKGSRSLWHASAIPAGFLLGAALVFTSCEVLDPGEPIPAYIRIDQITLTVNPVTEGTASCKITDAWVYCDGTLVGVFELPCSFPVLEEGFHDIIIKAGIKVNGIAGSRGYYPFYVPYEQRIELKPGETVTMTPSVTYYPGKVQYKEGFEDGGISLEAFGDSDTNILKTNTPSEVFEGSYSGVMITNITQDYYFIATTDSYDMPRTGTPVFLEMNYKAQVPLIVGLIAITGGENLKKEIMILNSSDAWNKIYINLTGVTSSNQGASNFKLYFEVYHDAQYSEAKVFLDNLKLVYN